MGSMVVCLPGTAERRIAREAERHGHRILVRAKNSEELLGAIGSGLADSVVVGASPDRLTARVLDVCDIAGVRIVALAATDAERRHTADLGLHEVLDAEADWEQIEGLLSSGIAPGLSVASEADSANPQQPRRGEVVAVWGPAGAPGRTTVAITVAAELAAAGFTVALADADTHSGAVAPSLGMLDEAPGFAAACRLASTQSLTTAELERVSERYASPHGSFWVLTGIGRSHRWPELSAERVAATLGVCRSWVDYTVVDTGFSIENDEEISSDVRAPQRNAATITALREADRVVAVGAGDPVGLSRFLRAHVDLLDLVEAERVETVINRLRSSVIGANPSGQVEQTLLRFGGIVPSALVPHDQLALDAATLTGKTLTDVAARSAPRVALRTFVTTRFLPEPLVPGKRLRRSKREHAQEPAATRPPWPAFSPRAG